jgi:hypothetical protein
MSETSRPARTIPTLVFALSQIVIVGAAVAAVGLGLAPPREKVVIPKLRETPRVIRPTPTEDEKESMVLTQDQLVRVLTKLRPRFDGAKTKINHVDHALRFWSSEALFADKEFPSGEQLRELLLDHRRFEKMYGKEAGKKPLLINVGRGVKVRVAEGDRSSSHVDHTVASCAEANTPLSFPVYTPAGQTEFRALVEQVFRDFSLNQVEYEWSTMIFALFMEEPTAWRTLEGQEITFDRLAERIMRQEQPQGVCFGNHRLYSLVLLLRVHEETPILSDETHQRIVTFLQDMTKRLVAHQHEDGFWNGTWPTEKPKEAKPQNVEGDRLSDRIIATGHALEWWAMVPKSLASTILPEREVIARAAQWVVKTVDAMEDRDIVRHFTFLSHAGRSLALWRGKFAYEVDLRAP